MAYFGTTTSTSPVTIYENAPGADIVPSIGWYFKVTGGTASIVLENLGTLSLAADEEYEFFCPNKPIQKITASVSAGTLTYRSKGV